MGNDLEKVRKYFGEELTDYCIKYLPTIAESGRLYDTIHERFSNGKLLFSELKYRNLEEKFRRLLIATYIKDPEIDELFFDLPGYVRDNTNRYHKYNFEYNNIYYCPINKIIKNGEVKYYDINRYIVFNCYIVDLEKKEISIYDKTIKEDYLLQLDKAKIDRIIRTNKGVIIETKKHGTFELSNIYELKRYYDKGENIDLQESEGRKY